MTGIPESAGAPPGSLLWHALLYAPPSTRAAIATVFELESVVRSLADASQDHAVAHAKLGWWQDEARRLEAGEPRHPLTRRLLEQAGGRSTDWSVLGTALDVARLELAGVALDDERDLRDYLARTSVGWQVLAARLSAPATPAEAARRFAEAIGRVLRLTEILGDLPRDARAGRILVPTSWLEEHGLEIVDLYTEAKAAARSECLARCAELVQAAWRDATQCERPVRAALRTQWVLGRLHLAMLERLRRNAFSLAPSASRLSGGRRLFIAWRAAREAT